MSEETMPDPNDPRFSTPRFALLHDAHLAVSRTEYGSPEDSFLRIANLWNEWLHARGFDLFPESRDDLYGLSAADVSVMLMLMKVARLMANVQHRDSIVDIAGYAACLAEIVDQGGPQ
jgi:hypothetical protein